jgi:hypothetical protein
MPFGFKSVRHTMPRCNQRINFGSVSRGGNEKVE